MDTANPTQKDNGNGATSAARIVLTFTASPWHVDIKAEIENFDQALAMLDQAKRYFEAQIRAAQAVQIQAQMQEQARAVAMAASVQRNIRGN